MLKKILLLIFFLSICTSNVHIVRAESNIKNYDVYIKTYKRNANQIEFAQIKGMKNKKKQTEINYLLEHEIFSYLTELYNYWGQEDDPNYKVKNILQTISDDKSGVLEFTCHAGYESDKLLSIYYEVYSYCYGGLHPNTWGFAYTLDLENLKVVHLSDFININNSILDLCCVDVFDRGYDPTPMNNGDDKLIDVLSNNGLYNKYEVLEKLRTDNVSWYITKNKELSFFYNFQNQDLEFVIDFISIKDMLKKDYMLE